MKGQKQLFGHASDEWGTPKDLFGKLNQIWKFDFDAACTKENCLCEAGLTKKENSLACPWGRNSRASRVFLNPPFSKLREFCAKAKEQIDANLALFVVALLPARTDTRAFHESIYGYAQIEFLRGRLCFEGASGPAPFPSMIVTWRKAW